jgi:hypothetical protein
MIQVSYLVRWGRGFVSRVGGVRCAEFDEEEPVKDCCGKEMENIVRAMVGPASIRVCFLAKNEA